jgi:predicted MPP superfamily phosphohydrolase
MLALADAGFVEPQWVRVRTLNLAKAKPTHRLVQISDIHHKGDRVYFEHIVKTVNSLSPDVVCFTGDLIEESQFLSEALQILQGIKSPVYGVPGNHDYWSEVSFEPIAKSLEKTGGGWLLDQQIVTEDGKLCITGATCLSKKAPVLLPKPGLRNIFLMHYPLWIEQLISTKFDLILAGHSHGGQVRIPFFGAVQVPFGVGKYDLGKFQTPAGILYVNSGLGWFPVPIRFNCRPEITVFEL